jgi:UDP-N-acetylmuramate--alanine ligase
MFEKKHSVHFVGIGGIGMSGIAEVLLNLGYKVSGSELRQSDATERLSSLGAEIYLGHRETNLSGDPSVVVISTAVKYTNPEVMEARRKNIPVIPRAEMLAELMRMKYGVAVAGSHGKTTTTSMIASVLSEAGLDPTMVIGGRVRALGSNARLGQGAFLVAEADESDGTFLLLSPTIAVVTNIDREHMDYYQNMERLNESFLEFINKVPFYGLAVLCLDHPNIRALLPKVKKRFVTYGFTPEAEYTAQDVEIRPMEVEFTVARGGKARGRIKLHTPGRHSAQNALAAVAAAEELEIPFGKIAAGLEAFAGIQRRFEIKGEARGVLVIDDYGHHPVEVQATIQAIRDSWKRPLTVVFQPHRFTRTRDLFEEFLISFDNADRLVLTDIYSAGEDAVDGVSSKSLYQAIKQRGHLDVAYVEKDEIVARLKPQLKPGDIVLTLGAGDIYRVGERLVQELQK